MARASRRASRPPSDGTDQFRWTAIALPQPEPPRWPPPKARCCGSRARRFPIFGTTSMSPSPQSGRYDVWIWHAVERAADHPACSSRGPRLAERGRPGGAVHARLWARWGRLNGIAQGVSHHRAPSLLRSRLPLGCSFRKRSLRVWRGHADMPGVRPCGWSGGDVPGDLDVRRALRGLASVSAR